MSANLNSLLNCLSSNSCRLTCFCFTFFLLCNCNCLSTHWRYSSIFPTVYLFIYLAFLAVQTGRFSLYCMSFCYSVFNLSKHNNNKENIYSENSSVSSLKTILFFTSFFDAANFQFGFGRKPFLDENCRVDNCFATNNRLRLA